MSGSRGPSGPLDLNTMGHTSTRAEQIRSRAACLLAAAGVLAVLGVLALVNGMTKPVGRDEQMYCTAGLLVAQGHMPYRDFSYAAQLPYHPLLCAAVFRVTGTTHYLLYARLVSIACNVLVMVLIVAIFRRVIRIGEAGTWLGLAGAVLYTFNPLVEYANGYAWNHDVVVMLVLASLWLFISTDTGRRSYPWRLAGLGALLTLAAGMRVTTVLTFPVFAAALCVQARRSGIRTRTWARPLGAGVVAAAAWPVWIAAQSPQALWINLVTIPRLYGRWLQGIGMTHNKAALTGQCLTTPGYLILVALVFGLVTWVWRSQRTPWAGLRGPFRVTAALIAVFCLIALIPPTMWHQYWAVPVPFLVVSLAFPLGCLARSGDPRGLRWGSGLAGLAVLATVASNPMVFLRLATITDETTWEPLRMHRLARQIADSVPEPRRVLTLTPLLASEGGCPIYRELSCGSIVYRIADQLTPAERQLTHTVGPESLSGCVEVQPASAILVGAEDPRFAFLEAPLQGLAGPDWPRFAYASGLVLYCRP